ncbi:hypothetical protein GCM10025857_07280 [Alicyclobacillus contaminans]|uniref:helix-turn-helix domain-containing protein n=1 Tax=Alicyclobacillus contaminans TaxID=392016 RepID=UPI000406563E|nr:helix-turn-helix transcriptional regulator [Alicyclobacillus contaminans]GMA49371.1 hypothetical protein GCM10025857_07280 [Alicyclobacillus contaminans]
MATFSERLRSLRGEHSVTQSELAKQIGLAERTLRYYESDTNAKEPTLSQLIKLADFFGVSIDYLVGRSDDPTLPSTTCTDGH